jgi:type II secretory pathway pseudopilin PulG
MTRAMLHRLRQQDGVGLIEVIVSAAVLALAAMAVLTGLEGAQASSGREKARSVAASLAEQDQESLRSLQFDTLDGYSTTAPPARTVTLDGITYTIKSSTTWLTDSPTGANQCTSSSSDANYLQLTSIVTTTTLGTQIPAVRVDSLEAPSVRYSATHGALGVKVVDHAGAGVPNIAVNIAGAESDSVTTDATGCAFFPNILTGTYTASLNTTGYVDQWGNQTPQLTDLDVAAGSVTVGSVAYDRAASVTASFETYPPNATSATTAMSSGAPTLTAANGTVVGLLRTYPPSPGSTGLASITADKLFPFTQAYAFFTGSCGYDNPSTNLSTYWSSGYPGQLVAQPGQSLAVTVRQPPLLVNILKDAKGQTVTAGEEKVVAYPQAQNGDTCVDQKITDLTTVSWPKAQGAPYPGDGRVPSSYGTPNDNGWVGRSLKTVGGKQVPESGVPFGKYQLCFQDTSKGSTYHWTYAGPYDNTLAYPGTTGATSNLKAPLELTPGTWTSGACP